MGDHSPLMFESDDEDDVDTEETKSIKRDDNEEKEIVEECSAKKKFDKLRLVLSGVPPPPTLTFLQMDARHLLELWNQNSQQINLQDVSGRETMQLEKDLSTKSWLESISNSYHGIYYNRSSYCEQVEALSLRYQERFVGQETSSSVNSVASRSPPKTASARKRARRLAHGGHSPGRRLSHLARRRNTFSSLDLSRQQAAGPALSANQKKMILINNKLKTNARNKRLKNSASKNTTATVASVGVSGAAGAGTSIPKRALFQSPENGGKRQAAKTPLQKAQQRGTRRALFAASREEGGHRSNLPPPVLTREDTQQQQPREAVKRPRDSDSCAHAPKAANHGAASADMKRRCTRSLLFEEEKKEEGGGISSSPPLLTAQTLSKLHKQKLLWAVSGALREQGIKIKDALFQPCASLLFNQCKKIWLEESATTKSAKGATSTSDKMLEIVKRHCSTTVAKVSSKVGKPVLMAAVTEPPTKPLQARPQNVLLENGCALKSADTDILKKSSCADDVSLLSFKNCDTENDRDTKTCTTVNAS